MVHFKYLRAVLRHKWFVLLAGLGHVGLWQLIKHDWSKFTPSEWFGYARHFYGGDYPTEHWCNTIGVPFVGANPLTKERVAAEFDRAWLHHQQANPHHWQYWLVIDSARLDLSLWPEDYTPRICRCIHDRVTGHDGGMMPREKQVLVRSTDLLVEDSGKIVCLRCRKSINREALVALPMPEKYRREMLADWRGAGRAYGNNDTAGWYEKNAAQIVLHPDTREWVEREWGFNYCVRCGLNQVPCLCDMGRRIDAEH